MSKPKGGWQKLQEAQEKQKKEKQVLEKTASIFSYFPVQNNANKVEGLSQEDTHSQSKSDFFSLLSCLIVL